VSRNHHRKHRQRCHKPTRALHSGRSHRIVRPHRDGRARLQSRKHSPLLHARPVHAKRAGHTGEAGPTVTLSPPAATTAATIASVLATPCQNTDLTPEAGNLEQVRAAILCLVNQERARSNEFPLQLNAQLAQAAQGHSEDMVGEDYFAHIAPNGETPLNRVEATGYIPNSQVGYTIGENIAWGTLYLATPSSIVAAWIASPEHLANILDADYRDTAIGVTPAAPRSLANGQTGAMYTQEFGVIDG
jgi:uncharacterized protein YkwD